jgi:hypothetical protein
MVIRNDRPIALVARQVMTFLEYFDPGQRPFRILGHTATLPPK